ncbi:hypothetical protein V6N11_017516 [Hibiscus sabdariffa]|uniref:Nodulin-like domain-containing protein n=1 Tax=Hibiscus sabdariffa TaxID=183260 RepID=A0ABR2TYY4_9ROSI
MAAVKGLHPLAATCSFGWQDSCDLSFTVKSTNVLHCGLPIDRNAMVFSSSRVEIRTMIHCSRRLVLLVTQALDIEPVLGQPTVSMTHGPTRWVPHVVHWVKLNTDRARRSEDGFASCEGVARDSTRLQKFDVTRFSGTNFDFSSYSSTLKSILGISQLQLNYLSVASDMGKAFGWCCGVSLVWLPLWVVLFMFAFFGVFGYRLQWLVIKQLITLPYFLKFPNQQGTGFAPHHRCTGAQQLWCTRGR